MPTPRTPRSARPVLVPTAAVCLALLAATGGLEYWYESGKTFEQLPWVKWPLILLNLGREQTFGSWWTGALLATAGALFFVVGALRSCGTASTRRALLPLLGGLVLIGLSLDEVAGLHERIFAGNPSETADFFASPVPWLLPVVPVVALLLLLWRRRRDEAASSTCITAWAGIAALSTVPLLQQVEDSSYAPGGRPPWLLLIEEGTELLGAWLLFAAAVLLLPLVARQDAAGLAAFREQLRRRWWLVFNAAGVLSVLGTQAATARYGDYAGDPQVGLPQWWFGSLGAAALACAAFLAQGRIPRSAAYPAGALSVIGWAALLLSMAYGVDGFTWLLVADDSLDRTTRVVVAVVLGIAGLWLALTSRLAGLAVAATAVVLALGQAAASAWEVGACWAAAALILEATTLREQDLASGPAPASAPAPAARAPLPGGPQPKTQGKPSKHAKRSKSRRRR